MFKKIIVGLSVLILILLAYAAIQPARYSVQRSIAIKAPAEKILPLISDFHHWPQWSPWENIDPNLKRTYSGAPSGKGAVYAWQGDKNVGSGRMEIVDQTPAKVDIKLEFFGAIASTNDLVFTLEPQGDTTTVRWSMSGTSDFMAKLMNIFISMDSMIGPAFDSGLTKIKAVAEK